MVIVNEKEEEEEKLMMLVMMMFMRIKCLLNVIPCGIRCDKTFSHLSSQHASLLHTEKTEVQRGKYLAQGARIRSGRAEI